MVRLRVRKPRFAQLVLVVLGGLMASAGVALVFPPAGLILAGLGTALYGFFLVDDGEDAIEPRTARPRPRR